MSDIAIIGAGELGGAIAYVLARRDFGAAIRLIDDAGHIAEGKALDIAQAGPIDGFAATVSGSTDLATAGGADIVVMADRADGTEWQGDDGLAMLRRLVRFAPHALIVCAGATQGTLVERGVRDLHIRREHLVGTAPAALAAAARAVVALAIDASPRDVALSLLGVPPSRIVIPWNDATVAGLAVTRLIDEPTRRQLHGRIAAMWPPGPHALASAVSQAVEGLIGRSRTVVSCFVAPDDSSGRRMRTAAMPVQLGSGGIERIVLPSLDVVDRVALDNAMLL